MPAHIFREFRIVDSEENFGAHNFNDVASDADVDHSVSVFRGTHENTAAALHFDTLLDQYALVGTGNAMGYHPRGGTAGGRSGGGIFSVVEEHARLQTSPGIYGLAADEIEKLRIAL